MLQQQPSTLPLQLLQHQNRLLLNARSTVSLLCPSVTAVLVGLVLIAQSRTVPTNAVAKACVVKVPVSVIPGGLELIAL